MSNLWLWTAVGSAILLGIYDVFKKQASTRNDVLHILLYATALSTLLLSPFIIASAFQTGWFAGTVFDVSQGTVRDHLLVLLKACIVSVSWITGLMGLKNLPITTAGTIKASRPVFVLIFSIIIFGERLNLWQWVAVIVAMFALWLLGRTSKQEGVDFVRNKWIFCMWVAVITGVISALMDKHLMGSMEPMFVQGWCNFYIALIMAAIVLFGRFAHRDYYQPYKHDWAIWLIALFITASDFLYFLSLHSSGAMLSVVSMLRRSSVIITFVFGAILFKEKRLRSKGLALLILLIAMAILVFSSR
ncbi:MAG: DMT family transporter [Bacteroidales bacterium]|jgi:transporter family protein|nr:DMT family transporter [Bacteroidales bacterium]